ncbi:MAG: alpha/beta fold hydrolase [Vulcanimicrobiota bacterium]
MLIRGKTLAVNNTPGSGARPGPVSQPVYEIARTLPSDTWEQTEVIRDRDPLFVQRDFHPRSKHRDPRVIEAFGTDTPHSGDALLHYAGSPRGEGGKTPVLLVHGANKNGHFFWDPKEDGSDKGLAQRLRDEGHDVYALTFAHNQDDNFVWAEQIANALAEIKKDTGADKVDLVAHSKGGVAARIYTSEVRKEGVESTPYQDDVRRMVLVGAPNKGVDYTFRHPSANYALLNKSDEPFLNAPVSWEKMGTWPFSKDVSKMGYSADSPDYFPGQRQLLADLSRDYPLSVMEPDWYTTYHGGTGFNSVSKGIRFYVEQGENVIARLNENPPDAEVEVAVLAGNRANIPGILNEYTGPSDGLVFVESALSMPVGTNLVAQDVLPLHHKALISEEAGQDWIVKAVENDRPKAGADIQQVLNAATSDWKSDKVQQQAIEQIASLAQKSDQPDHPILPMV